VTEILVDGAVYTESPRWHDGAFWYSDIGANEVCRVGPDGRREVVVSSIPHPSGLGWTRSGELLVAALLESTIYRVGRDGIAHPFCTKEQHGLAGTNDMATVGARSYVTSSNYHYEKGADLDFLTRPVGAILMIDHDTGAHRVVASGYRMPNGVAVSADGRSLVVSELWAKRILSFDILEDGALGAEPKVLAQNDFITDGLCLDAEGGVWLGAAGEQRCQRIDAQGRLAETVETPGWSCIAPMLGGPDGRTLFMAVSQMDSPDDIFEGRAKSRILTARVAIPAAAAAS
jgi:sugar lactone lactonase YvrE